MTKNVKDEVKKEVVQASKNANYAPTNDYVFKRIFGKKGNEEITRRLLELITKEKFKDIKLDDTPILEADVINGKKGVLDVIVKSEEEDVDIEMQVASSKYMGERILWYWSKMYVSSLGSGEEYSKAKKVRSILIADYEVEDLIGKSRFHTHWKIKEDEYDIPLTEKLQFDIIELGKLENSKSKADEELKEWCRFIKSPEKVEESIMEKYEELKKAKEKLDEINSDEQEKRLALLRERALHDEATMRAEAFEEGVEKGKKEGIDEGIAKGKTEGKKFRSIEIAKKLLTRGMQIDEISVITELSKEEIEKLK